MNIFRKLLPGLSCLLLFMVPATAQQMDTAMVFVKGGTFEMGCTFEQGSDCSYDEKPAHEVALQSFAIAKTEVTQRLWAAIMGNNPSRFKGDDLPVENVSYDDVLVFIQRLNQRTGMHYRLPTEAEWEYAARGGIQSRQTQFAGSANLESVAWMANNSANTTHPVGTKTPNELGLYDMSGNVWEWCSDLYGAYSANSQMNPAGAEKGTARVVRGGCFAAIDRQCRVSARRSYYGGGREYSIGFRLAMDDDREERAEAARKAAEQQRIAEEKAAAETAKIAEQERIAAEKQAEQERIAAQKAAAEAAKKAEQETRKKECAERLAAIPKSTLFTLNAQLSNNFDWAVGFKVGTMKTTGWYFSALTNFTYRGMFTDFKLSQHYELNGRHSTSYLEAMAGITSRRYHAVSFHFGAGGVLRTYNLQATDGSRYRYLKNSYYGPAVSTGLMFHISSFVFSVEGTGMLNLNSINPNRIMLGGKAGIGFCIPNKGGRNSKPAQEQKGGDNEK